LRTYRHLAEKMGMSKGGEKQWQTTPKNLPRISVQSHTGHMTGLWFLPTRPLRLNTDEWMNHTSTVMYKCDTLDYLIFPTTDLTRLPRIVADFHCSRISYI